MTSGTPVERLRDNRMRLARSNIAQLSCGPPHNRQVAIERRRRLKLAVRHAAGYSALLTADSDQTLYSRIPRRHLFIAQRPIHSHAVITVWLPLLRAPPGSHSAPAVRLPP